MAKADTLDAYALSVNRAIDYVTAHLGEPLPLAKLAEQGCFSPCHFHRVFKAIVGETHQDFIQRLRLERAVQLLGGDQAITDIALNLGFSSPAHFAHDFKVRYGQTPRAYRADRAGKNRKNPIVSAPREVHTERIEPIDCAVRVYPPYRVAYVRHIGGYGPGVGKAWQRLMGWARRAGVVTADSLRISCSWDDPELTEDARLRYDACLTVPNGVVGEGPIGIRELAGGRYAVARYRGPVDALGAFYDAVYGTALRQTGLALGYDPGYRVHRETAAEQIASWIDNELRIPLAE
jgi:AraC family transcriptional regulator